MGVEVNETSAVALGLLSALALAALHLLAPRIRKLPFVPEPVTASLAGGVAVAYVFLHLLPELAEGNERITAILGDEVPRSPLLELGIFFVALLGFLIFYGLERLAERSRRMAAAGGGRRNGEPGRSEGEPGGAEGAHGGDGRVPGSGQGVPAGGSAVFGLHLGSFLVYNAIIAYTLPLNWRQSVPFAVLFTIAMGLHFVLSDRGLEEHYGSRFDRWPPRLALAGALLLGWALAALVAPTSGVVVSLLTAFLSGSILLNVFKEEIPSARRSHFGWFAGGLAGYALLLGLVTATAGTGESSTEDKPEADSALSR